MRRYDGGREHPSGTRTTQRAGLVDRDALRTVAAAALDAFREVIGDGIDPDTRVAALSADQGQMVEILKVLAARPRIIIFDEATAALDRNQVAAVFDTYVRSRRQVARSYSLRIAWTRCSTLPTGSP